MVKQICIKDAHAAERISDVASKQNFPVSISYGENIVDARSLLCILPFVGKEVNIVGGDNANPNDFLQAVEDMKLD